LAPKPSTTSESNLLATDRSTDDVKKQWKMMENDAKIQVPRWEKSGFNTHQPSQPFYGVSLSNM
jgi:hypothetical protein